MQDTITICRERFVDVVADANSLDFNLEVGDVSRFGQLKVEPGTVTMSFSR